MISVDKFYLTRIICSTRGEKWQNTTYGLNVSTKHSCKNMLKSVLGHSLVNELFRYLSPPRSLPFPPLLPFHPLNFPRRPLQPFISHDLIPSLTFSSTTH